MSYKYRVMAVYISGLFMTIIDGTIVNVALPTLAKDFGVPSTDVEWIAIAYLLAFAGIIPAAGWLGDRFGSRKMFIVSLVLFVLGSVLCGISTGLTMLVVMRVFQGLGAGLITPIGSAMLFKAFPLEERSTATIGVMSVAVIAPAIGPVLGGVIVDNTSWRWIFLVNLPVGVIALALALRWLREEPGSDPGRFDLPGLVLSATSVPLLIYALSTGAERGWLSPITLVAGVLGVVCLVALIVHELRVRQPMLHLDLFRDRLFRTINIAGALLYSGFFGWIFVLPLYMQTLRGFSATTSGLVQMPQAIAIFLVSNLLGRRVYRTVGPRRLLVVGTLATTLATGVFFFANLDTPLWMIAAGSFARGASIGLVFISIQTAVYATVPLPRMGRATSLFNTQRQFAYACGIAVAATVLSVQLTSAGGDTAPAIDRVGAYQWAFLSMAVLMVPAIFVSMRVVDDDAAATRGIVPARDVAAAPGH